jgi:hypothetical protein
VPDDLVNWTADSRRGEVLCGGIFHFIMLLLLDPTSCPLLFKNVKRGKEKIIWL